MSKSTHIILSIEELEKIYKDCESKSENTPLGGIALLRDHGKRILLKQLIRDSRKVSLSEEDIEQKAKESFDDSYALKEVRVQAYKQALLDLKSQL
jgi:hypothetical protein